MDDPSFPEIAHLAITVEHRVDEVGVEFGEDLGDKDRSSNIIAVTAFVIATARVYRPLARPRRGSG